MAPLNIPEGFTFVKRGPGVAAALLEAADAIGEDRKTGVRTTSSGGYYVKDEIAEEWQKSLPDSDETDGDETGDDGGQAGLSAEEIEARGYPEGDPVEKWTVKNLEAWAAAQDPAVDLGDGDKPSKLKAALDSLESE